MNFEKNIIVAKREAITVLWLKLFFCIVLLLAVSLTIIPKAKADILEEDAVFFIDSAYDLNSRSEINVSLKKISSNGYFYVEDDYYDNLSSTLQNEFDNNLIILAADFDSIIYPRMRDTFGTEWNPGIDDDSKITILLTQTKENIGGYFNPSDEYYKEKITNGRSNEREMVYLNAIFVGNKRIKSFLAHEFQHMITWYHKTKIKNISDDIWLNEARSEFASTAIGYDDIYKRSNLEARIENFQLDPIDSLIEWQNKIYDYSSVNLFSQYLADRFGKNIFKEMINNDEVGIKSINKALDSFGFTDITFNDVFVDWTIANYLNDKSSKPTGIYSYKNENISFDNFHIPISNNFIIENDTAEVISDSIKDWSSEYFSFKINNSNNDKLTQIKISFNGQDDGNFSVPYIILFEDKTKEINHSSINDVQDSIFSISNKEKDIHSIIIIPISNNKSTGIGSNASSYTFSLKVENITLNTYENNSLLMKKDGSKVYLIENGTKRWITTTAVFIASGYNWDDIIAVSESELSLYTQGKNVTANFSAKPNGTLLKGSGPKVYLIENGTKRWITDATIFIASGYDWNNIITISESELNIYSHGENIYANSNVNLNGTLLKSSGPKVYLIKNGIKRWITSESVFINNGYNWNDIITISESELNIYPHGGNIQS